MAEEPNTVGADAGNGDDTTKSPGTENQPSEETKNAEAEQKQEEKKLLTQEEVDKAIKRRLAEDRAKREKEFEEKLSTVNQELEARRKKEAEEELAKEEAALKRAEEKGDYEKRLEIERKRHADTVKEREDKIAALTDRAAELEKKLAERTIDQNLLSLLASRSVKPEAAVKLIKADHRITIDPTTLEPMVDGDASTTLSEIVDQFLKDNAYLDKGNYAGKNGGGSAPGGDKPATTGNTFTTSQLADLTFYKEHQAELDKAVAEGRIVEG